MSPRGPRAKTFQIEKWQNNKQANKINPSWLIFFESEVGQPPSHHCWAWAWRTHVPNGGRLTDNCSSQLLLSPLIGRFKVKVSYERRKNNLVGSLSPGLCDWVKILVFFFSFSNSCCTKPIIFLFGYTDFHASVRDTKLSNSWEQVQSQTFYIRKKYNSISISSQTNEVHSRLEANRLMSNSRLCLIFAPGLPQSIPKTLMPRIVFFLAKQETSVLFFCCPITSLVFLHRFQCFIMNHEII